MHQRHYDNVDDSYKNPPKKRRNENYAGHVQLAESSDISPRLREKKIRTHKKSCNLNQMKRDITDSVLMFFEAYGYFVFNHPWKFVIIPIVLCIIGSYGFLIRESVYDMDTLYSLPVSTTKYAEKELLKSFPIQRTTYILLVSKTGKGILTRQTFDDIDQLWSRLSELPIQKALVHGALNPLNQTLRSHFESPANIKQLQYDPNYKSSKNTQPATNSTSIQFGDVCERTAFGNCNVVNPLDIYLSPSQRGSAIKSSDYPNFINFRTRSVYRLDSIMGGLEIEVIPSANNPEKDVTYVKNATSLAFRLVLLGGEEFDELSAAWEQAAITFLQNFKLPTMEIYVRCDRSVNDELARSSTLTGHDLTMLLIASLAVSVFTVVLHSSLDRYRTKTLPTLIGVGTTILAYCGSVGFLYWIGLHHVPPAEATPFMMLGICVDDVFVITNAYALTYLYIDQPKKRIGLSIRDTGVSISITTLTNVIAFLAGVVSPYYAIRIFCILTAFGIMAGYILCLTTFLGALSIAARYEQYRTDYQNRFQIIKYQTTKDLDVDNLLNSPKIRTSSTNTHSSSSLQPLYSTTKRQPNIQQHDKCDEDIGMSSVELVEVYADNVRDYESELQDKVYDRISYNNVIHESDEKNTNEVRARHPSHESINRPCLIYDADPILREDENASIIHNVNDEFKNEEFTPYNGLKNNGQDLRDQLYLKDGYYQIVELDNYALVSSLCSKKQMMELNLPTWNFRKKMKLSDERNNRMTSSSIKLSHNSFDLSQETFSSLVQTYKFHNLPTLYEFRKCNFTNKGMNEPIQYPRWKWMLQSPNKKDAHCNRQLSKFSQYIYFPHGLPDEPIGNVGRIPRKLFMYYGPCLLYPYSKCILLFLFLLLTVLSGYFAAQLESGLALRDITPYESYLRDFLSIQKDHFSAYGDECFLFFTQPSTATNAESLSWTSNFFFRSRNQQKENNQKLQYNPVFDDANLIDTRINNNGYSAPSNLYAESYAWWDPATQRHLIELDQYLNASPNIVYVLNGFSYFFNYVQAQNATINTPETFMNTFKKWRSTLEGTFFASDFLIINDTLTAWRLHYWMEYIENTRTAIGWIEDVRKELRYMTEQFDFPTGYVYSPLAVHWESDLTIVQMTLATMSGALVAMSFVSFLLLRSWIAGFVVFLDIIFIDLAVVGTMHLIGLKSNMLTMVNLVLSVGFAVDYTTHITHCFTHCKGRTKNQRALESLCCIGFPITEGMITTYLAVGVLAVSKKYILVVVFRMMTCVLIYASLHGIVLIPVILSIIGPFQFNPLRIASVQKGRIQHIKYVDGKTGELLPDQSSYTTSQSPDKNTSLYVAIPHNPNG